MNINRKLKKSAALFILCTFLAGDIMPANLFAAPEISAPQTPDFRKLKLAELKISEKTGTVQEIYQPETLSPRPAVILIQDAHAVPEAQQNIRKTILFFQKQYGADLIALEGAASKLDARIFKSFPEKEKLKKVLYGYAREAEVSGGTLAALLDPSDAEYDGIEDWGLYQEGISDYLRAVKNEKDISGEIRSEQTRLTEEKKRVYSPVLLEADAALQEMEGGGKHFLKAFETLAKIRRPGASSPLTALLTEMESSRREDGRFRDEVLKAWTLFSKLASGAAPALNRTKQSFDLGEISAAQFALEIQKAARIQGVVLPQSETLNAAVKHLRRLESLRGPELMEAVDAYGREVEDSLIQNEAQRDLARRSREFYLASKMARLELTRKEWEEVRDSQGSAEVWASLEAHRDFYENAEQRDGIFLEKIETLLKKRGKTSAPALLVAGGFHTQGMARRLKEKNIPYAVISPAISRVPAETNYRKQMRGDVSWKNYFREQKEKVSLYEAFVRGVRDRLLESQNPVLIKQWRDRIILDLAAEKRLADAGNYTRFLDELSKAPAESREGLDRLKQFTDGLLKLEADAKFSKADILQLFQTAAASTPTLVNSPAMLTQDKASARLVRGEPLPLVMRAEGREQWEEMKLSGIPAKTLLYTVRESSQPAERIEAFYKLRSNWSRLPEEVREHTAFYLFSDPDPKLRQMVIPLILRLPDVQDKLEAFIRDPLIYDGEDRDPRLPANMDFNPQIARYLARTAALFILFGKKNYVLGMSILKRELPHWDAKKEKRLIGLYNGLPVGLKSHIREAPLGVDAPLSVLESLRLYQIWRLRRYEDLPNGIDSAEGQKAANMSFYTGENIDKWFPKELLEEEDGDEEGEPVNPEAHAIQTAAAKIIHAPAARAETRDQPEDAHHYEGLLQYYEAFQNAQLFPDNKKAELRRAFAGLSFENYSDRIPQLAKALIAASSTGLSIASQYEDMLLQAGVPQNWRPGTPLMGKARFNMAKLSETKRAADYIRQFSEGAVHYAVAITDSYYESRDPEAGLRAALSAFPLNPANSGWVQDRRNSMFPQLRRLGWYNLAEQIARQYLRLPSEDLSRENFMIWLAMLQRQSLFRLTGDLQNTAISSIRAAVQQISDIQAAATLPAEELAFRMTSKKALLIELSAALISKGDKESLIEALRLLDEAAILGAAPSSYSLLGFYASRALMILTAEEAASAGWSRLMPFRRTGPTADDYEQRAESYLNVYIDQYLPTLLEGSLDLRARWREYGKASLALAQKKYEEADHYFALASNSSNGELKTVVLFEHSLALLNLGRVQDTLETARAYLQMIAIFDETDEFRDFHLAAAIHFYPPGYLNQFLDIAYSIFAEPRYWPEEEHRQLLKAAVRYLVRSERMTDDQVHEAITRWINLRGEDAAGLLRETPFILQVLSGTYSMVPHTVRNQVLLWAAALEVKHPEAAKLFLDFLEKESRDSLAQRGTLKIATQLVLLELAKDAGNFHEFNHEASHFIQNFFVESLLASDFDASAVFRALYEVETLLQEELGYHHGLTNASLYSMAISAMTTLYASLNVEVTIEAQNQTLSRLLQEKQTKLRETLVQALQEELKAGNEFYEESLSRSDELWRLTFFRIRIEALRMMNAPPAAQNNAMADYIAAYQPTAEANRRKIPNGFITTRVEAPGVFMRYLDALIMKGDYAKAGAVMAVYLPELEAAVDFLRRTDSSSPERGPFLHVMHGAFSSMHFKSLSYLLREGSALREPLRKLLEMTADISESTDTEADRSKAAALAVQIASIAALSGQMEIVSRKAQEVLELNDSLEEREISDLQGRFELYLLLAHEYGQKELNDEKEQAKAGALRVLEVMERRFQGNSEERPWLIASQAGFLNYSGHEEDAIQHVVTERDAVQMVHPQLGAYYNYVLTGFYLENGRHPEAVESLLNYLRYRVEESSHEDQDDDNGIVTEAIFWPAGKKKNIVRAYIDVLKEHPELSQDYTERVLRSVYFLDYKNGLNEVAGYVQGLINNPVPFKENPERILTMIGWLMGTGHDPAALIDFIEKLSARPEMSKSLKHLKQAREQLEKMTTLNDWRNVLRTWFEAGAYDEVIQRVEVLRRRKDFAADHASSEILQLQRSAKERKEVQKQIRETYSAGNYVKAFQMYEEETRQYVRPAALDKMMQTAAVLVKAETLMRQGLWSDALAVLEAAPQDLRDKIYAKALQAFGEFKETLLTVEAHLQRKYFREADHLLKGAAAAYLRQWKHAPELGQGNHRVLHAQIVKMKTEWAAAVQKLSRARGYAEIKRAAFEIASEYPEEINAAFEELTAKSIAVFNLAGQTRDPQKREQTYLEAFHLGRLVYELAAEYPASAFSLSRADQVISQAMGNYWIPQLTDDFWITHAMAEAEREKEEVHEAKKTVSFTFPKGKIDFMKHIRILKLNHSEADRSGNPVPVNLKTSVEIGDTFRITPAAAPEGASLKPLRYLFKVTAVDEKTGTVSFDIPKSLEKPEKMIPEIVAALTNGGTITRMSNNSWVNQRETLRGVIRNMKSTIVSRIDVSDLEAPVLNVSTGNPVLNRMFGLSLSDSSGDADSLRKMQQWNEDLIPVVDAYVAKEKEAQAVQGKNFDFDPEQKNALMAILNPYEPVVMIQGPPGTGKTTVLKAAIRLLMQLRQGVLVTSQQNHAIDKVVLKTIEGAGPEEAWLKKLVRTASSAEGITHEDILRIYGERIQRLQAIEKEDESRGPGPAVAGTAVGLTQDRELRKLQKSVRKLKTGIMDESSRATRAESLHLLIYFDALTRLISVGDPFQLPAYGVTKDDVSFAAQWLGKGPLQDDEMGSREFAEVFKYHRRKNFKISLFEKTLGLFLDETRGIDKGVFRVTTPPFFYFDVNRRFSGWLLIKHSNYFYGKRKPLRTEKTEPGYFQLDDTEGLSPEADSNGRYPLGAVPTNERVENASDEDETFERYNLGEVDRSIYWINHFINHRNKNPEKIAVITPFRRQVTEIKKSVLDIAKLHAYLREKEAGENPPEDRLLTVPVERYFRTRVYLENLARFRTQKLPTRDQGAFIDSAARRLSVEYRDLIKDKSPEAKEKARVFREKLGLGENFVKVTAGGKIEMDVRVITPRKKGKPAFAELDDELEGMKTVTVDSSIGDEWEGVIVSWVRSNAQNEVGFLADEEGAQRRNVADSRGAELVQIMDVRTFTGNKNRNEKSRPSEVAEWAQHKLGIAREARALIGDDSLIGLQARHETRGKEIFNTVYLKGDQVPETVKAAYRSLIPLELLNQLGIPAGTKLPVYGDEDAGGEKEWAIYLKPLGRGHFRIDLARSKAEVAVNEENPFDDKVFLADVGLRMREDGTIVIETPGRIAPFAEANEKYSNLPSLGERAFVFWVENYLMPFAVQVNARSIEITRSYLSPEALVRSRFVLNPLAEQFTHEWVRTEGLLPQLRDDGELKNEIREIADRRREQADAAIDYLNQLPAGPKVNIYVYNQDSNGVFGGAYLLAREIRHRIKNALVRMLLVDGRMPSAFRGIPNGIEVEQEFKPHLEQGILKDSDFNFIVAGSKAYQPPPLPPEATVTTGGYFSRDFHESVFQKRKPVSLIHMDFTNPHSTVQLVTENREAIEKKDRMSFEELAAAKENWHRMLARDRDRLQGEEQLQSLLSFAEKKGWKLGASIMTWTYHKDFTFVFKEIEKLARAVESGTFEQQRIWAPDGRQILIHASISKSQETVSMMRFLEEKGISYISPMGEIHEGRLPITVVFHERISHGMMQELQVLSGTMKRDEEENRWIGFPAWPTGWGSSLETISLGTPWLHDRFDAGEKEFDSAFYALMDNVLKLQAGRQLPAEISGMDAEETANEFFLGSERKAARYEDLKTWSRLSRWLSDSLYQMNMADDLAIQLAKQKGFVPARLENREQQNPDQQLVNPMLRREGGRAGNLVADMKELLTLYPDSPARAELERAIQQYAEAAASHWKSQSMMEFHGMLHYQDAYEALARFYEQTVLADISLPAEIKIHVRTFAPLDPSRIYLDPQWNDRVIRQKYAYHFSQNAYRIRINGKDYLIGKGTYLEFEYPDGTSDFLYDHHNIFYAFAALKASKIKNKHYVLYDEHSDAGEAEAVEYASQDPFETAQIYHIENFHSGILKDILLKEKGWRWTWVAHHWEEDPEARSFFDDIADFDAFELTEKGGMAGIDLDMLSRGVGSLLSDANIMKLYQKDRGKLIQQLPGFETRAFFISDEHFVKPAAALRMFGDLITEISKAKKAQSLHEPRVSAEEQRRILLESAEWESKIFLDGKVREDVSQEMLEQARIFYDQINPWDWRGHELDQARKDFHRNLRLILTEQSGRSTVQFEYVDLIAHQLANFLNTMQLLGIRTDKLPGHVHEQAEELYRYLKVRIERATHVMTAKKLSKEEEAADLTKKTTELLLDINRLSTGWKFRKFLKELKEIDDPAFKKKADAAAATLEKTSSTAAEFARGWLGIEEPKVSSVDLAMTFTRVMRAHPDLREAGEIRSDLKEIYEIQTYEVYLTEVLLNFLNNAAQALPPASERPRKAGDVTLSARKLTDEKVEIVIEDKGLGISPEHVKNILAMKQFTTKETGHGLGMPRAISLVQGALQGSFEIESEVGKGTKITLRFPLTVRAEGRKVDRAMERFSNETDKAQRIELAHQLGVDTRLSLANYMDPAYVGYAMAVKQEVNPENRPMTAVYGGAGAGWPIFALSTNATEVYMAELLKPDPLKLQAAYQLWDNLNITPWPTPIDIAAIHYNTGHGAVIEFRVFGLERFIMEGLKAAGVSRTRADGSPNIQFQTLPDGSLKIQFLWAYPGEEEKLYTLVYVQADITQPALYPEILRESLSRGIDLYYQRASLEIPEHYREFLPQIAAAVRPGGFLVTDDTSTNLGSREVRMNNPDNILEETGGNRWGKRGEILTPSMEGFGEAIKLVRDRIFFEGVYGWEMQIRRARAEGRKVDRAMEKFSAETDVAKRIDLARELGVDTRLSLANYMDPAYVGYAMAVKQEVNPENKPLTAVYGGAGAGWPIFALSTNATEVYMVDTVKQMNPLKLEALYQQWDALDITADLKNPFDMAGMHYKTGFGSVIKFALYGLEPSIIEGLKAAGVSKLRPDGSRNIQIQTLPDGSLKIQFHWAYPGAEEKLYTITYVYADITKPSEYPEILQERLRQGIDLYYQRAPLDIPEHYKEFLPQIAAAVRPGGFLVTDDYSTNLSTGKSLKNNSDKILKEAENRWGKQGSILTPEMDGFGEAIKALRRRGIYHDSPDAEISYGWKMEIRQRRAEARSSVAEGPLPKALEKKTKPEEPSGNRRKAITIRSESRPDPEVEEELKELLLSAPVFYERKGIGRVVDLSKLNISAEKDYLFTALLIRLKFLQISRIPERILRGTKPLLRSVRDQEGYKTLIFVTEQGAVDGFLLSRNYEGAWRGFAQMDWIISDENAVSGAGTLLMDSWLEELKKNEVTLATWIYRPESPGFFTPYLESRGLPSAPMDAQRFSLGTEILKAFNLPEEIKLHTSPRAEMRELADHTARFILSKKTGNAEELSGKISELKTGGNSVKQFAAMTDEAGLRIESEKEEALVQTAFDWMTEVMDSEGTLAAAFDVPASEKSVLEAALSRLQGKSASRWVAFVPQDLGEVNSGSMLTQRVRDLDRYKPVYAIRNVQIQNADRVARIRLGSPEKTGAVNPHLFYVSPNGSIASMDPALQRVIELAAGMMVGGLTAREIQSTADLQTSPADIEQKVLAAFLKGDYEDLIPQGKGLLSIGADGSIRIEMPVFSSLLQQIQSRREMAQSA